MTAPTACAANRRHAKASRFTDLRGPADLSPEFVLIQAAWCVDRVLDGQCRQTVAACLSRLPLGGMVDGQSDLVQIPITTERPCGQRFGGLPVPEQVGLVRAGAPHVRQRGGIQRGEQMLVLSGSAVE